MHLTTNSSLENSLPPCIAIVRSLPGLGDFLCAIPAFRALRTALPDAHITLIGLPQMKSLVHRFNHYLNKWLEFPGWAGIPEVPCLPQRSVAFLAQAQSLQFDLALQMHGNGSAINSFALLLGAKQTAGFFPAGHYCPHPDRFLPYPEDEPEIWRHLRLLEFLGIPAQGDQLEFPIWQSDWDELEAIASKRLLTRGDYVCIHPGASTGDRRWLPQHFAAVADALAAEGLQIVLTGTNAEADITQAVAEAMQFPAVDLTGQTSLGAIAALLKRSRLLICNDTGISHLAAALRVKSVVVFSNSDPRRWAPLDRQRHRAVGMVDLDSQNKNGMLRWWNGEIEKVAVVTEQPINPLITPEDVLTEAMDLLQQEFAYVS